MTERIVEALRQKGFRAKKFEFEQDEPGSRDPPVLILSIFRKGTKIHSQIKGNTYPIRDQIKQAGYYWDPDSRYWYKNFKVKKENLPRGCVQVGIQVKNITTTVYVDDIDDA